MNIQDSTWLVTRSVDKLEKLNSILALIADALDDIDHHTSTDDLKGRWLVTHLHDHTAALQVVNEGIENELTEMRKRLYDIKILGEENNVQSSRLFRVLEEAAGIEEAAKNALSKMGIDPDGEHQVERDPPEADPAEEDQDDPARDDDQDQTDGDVTST